MTDQTIKIADLTDEGTLPFINAQIAGISENQLYTLYFQDNSYYIWDNTKEEKVRDINHPYLLHDITYLLGGNRYSVSNDGKYISGVYDNREDERGSTAQVFVLDTTTNEISYNFQTPSTSFILGFSADGGYLFLTTAYNEITIHNVLSQFVEKTIEVDPGFIMSVRFSSDNKYMIINYEEGVSNVYHVEDGQLVGTIPGQVLHLAENDEGKVQVSAIYNNVGSRYIDFELTHEVSFDVLQDDLGSESKDRYQYNPKTDLLFVIKSRADKHRLYAIDFEQGYQIKTLDTNLSVYEPTGFISQEGDKIIFDYSYDAFLYPDFNADGHPKVAIFPLLDYDTIREESLRMVEGVELEESMDREEESK